MDEQTYYDPPRLAAWLLGWLLKDQWDTPLGDYEEYFNELAAEQGERRARWWYRGQVLRLLPDQLLEKTYWGTLMLKSYFLLGLRTLRKNKVASIINMVGLSAAVGIAIVIFLFTQEINTFEDFHENGDRVYLIGHTVEEEDTTSRWGTSPVPLGPALAVDFPQIERAVRYAEQGVLVQSGDDTFRETLAFADAGFFDMLTFPLAQGSEAALAEPNGVIISDDMAVKYFRGEDPLGQEIVITYENGTVESLVVRGVAEPFPTKTSLTFDFLVGYGKRLTAGETSLEDWAAFTDGTFIQLKNAKDQAIVAQQMDRYVAVQNAANASWQVHSYFLDNIQHPDMFSAWGTHDRLLNAPPIWESMGVGLIGLLVLLIACFNYITISLGAAARRLKEIGIRKTAGAEKRQLVGQFLTENLILCMLALLGGLVIARFLVLPFIYNLTSMPLRLDLFGNPGLWGFLVGLLAFIGLVSGAYPAFYISSFQPAEILRGKLKLAEKKGLTRTLTTVQFVLSIMTISISVFLVSLDDTLTSGDWGYTEEQTIVIPVISTEQYTRMQGEAAQLSQVAQVAGAAHHVGATRNVITVEADGAEVQTLYYGVGPTYLSTMGMQVVAGRAFGTAGTADGPASIVVNQTFVAEQEWATPLGKQVRLEDQLFTVVGVVEDFMVYPLEGDAIPVVFGLAADDHFGYMAVRLHDEAFEPVIASLRTIWKQHYPALSFEYYRQSEVFQEYDLILNLTLQFTRYLGLFALLISCMGLFGMASQRAAQRIKEVGIRKAMGASATQVVFLVNRGFLGMLAISTLIATPICYLGLSAALNLAPIEIPLDASPFILSNALVFLLATLSLSMQTKRLVQINPADVLRYE
ncbi:MAG TPA: ABC transporter permease [Rhodothermales bacterium]|nr:ABC transporter permease [Rhodothermales bacterium]